MTTPAPTTPATAVDPRIRDALSEVYDPCCRDKGISVVDMGLLHRGVVDEDGVARVEILLTTGWCPFANNLLTDLAAAVRRLPGVGDATVEIVWDEAWSPERLSESARGKLRFLPPPSAVPDPATFVDQHWANRGDTDDR
jgi:metal-sulfur cluster biosynthetic enzyme